MTRLRWATWLTLAGLGLSAGCSSPCGPRSGGLFGHHGGVPVTDCCPGGCGGGAPYGDGPILGDPGAGGAPIYGPGGTPIYPGTGGTPFIPGQAAPQPVPPDRLLPVPAPGAAVPTPAAPSSRLR